MVKSTLFVVMSSVHGHSLSNQLFTGYICRSFASWLEEMEGAVYFFFHRLYPEAQYMVCAHFPWYHIKCCM